MSLNIEVDSLSANLTVFIERKTACFIQELSEEKGSARE